MPQAKSKPSDIASEAKKTYTPYIQSHFPQWPSVSVSYPDSSKIRLNCRAGAARKLRVAVIDGDPVDVALDWHDTNSRDSAYSKATNGAKQSGSIPIISMANEKRAGGDWESGLIAPEECLCRRSNLAKVLNTPSQSSGQVPHYPIRTTGGIYSPHVGKSSLIEHRVALANVASQWYFDLAPTKVTTYGKNSKPCQSFLLHRSDDPN